jgi:hypothetical protein
MAAGQRGKNAQVQMHTSANPKYSPAASGPAKCRVCTGSHLQVPGIAVITGAWLA